MLCNWPSPGKSHEVMQSVFDKMPGASPIQHKKLATEICVLCLLFFSPLFYCEFFERSFFAGRFPVKSFAVVRLIGDVHLCVILWAEAI